MLCVDARRMCGTQLHHKPFDRMCFAGILRDNFVPTTIKSDNSHRIHIILFRQLLQIKYYITGSKIHAAVLMLSQPLASHTDQRCTALLQCG